ncbi:hypothetical protein DKL51_30225 [Micromonospora globispora]|nr:hypothetical protein DKL51_30225 [Micromonospora globispora]
MPEPETLVSGGRAKKANAPRKSAPRGTTPKTATPAKKASPAKKAATPAPPAAESAPEPATAVETFATAETRETPVVPAIAVPGRTPALREAASGRTAGVEWRAISLRVLDHPGFAPELLALAAVEALGPRAREWAEGLRARYPDADPDGLARLAARRFVRLAGTGGAVAAGAGLLAPVAELAAVLWTQANLVLHLAAAYGRDPAHPDRAVELLVLTQVHPDADSARTAPDAARTADGPGERPWPRAAEAAWRDAAVSHVRAGAYGAIWVAALAAAAPVAGGIDEVLDAGESVLPPGSRFTAAVREARALGAGTDDWESIVDTLYERHGHLHWVHVRNNAALVAAALAYGRGDLERSICAVVSGGWDTDSTGATVGAVTGALAGASGLPEGWVAPLGNRLASSIAGFDGVGFDALASRTLALARGAA